MPQQYGSSQRVGAPPSSPILYALLIGLLGLVIPLAITYSIITADNAVVVATVGALLAGMVIFARPYWGLLLFIGLLYTRPEDTFQNLSGLRLTLIVSGVTLIGTWCQMMMNREKLVRHPLVLYMTLFWAWAMVSSISYGTTGEAAQDIAKLVALVILVLNLIRTRERYQAVLSAVIVFTVYLAIFGTVLYFSGHALIENGHMKREEGLGIFGDPNDLAAAIVAGLALCLTRISQSKISAMRVFYIVLSAGMVFAIVLTNSRGGLLGLIAVIGGYMLVFVKRKPLAIATAICAAALLMAAAPGHMANFDSTEESANSRFNFWDTGFNELLHSPVRGVGYSRFPSINGGMHAHNSFVECFTDLGIPGYFLWMGGLYYCFKKWKPPAGDPPLTPDDEVNSRGVRLALVGHLVCIFWLSHTYSPILYLLMSLPVAQMLSATPSLAFISVPSAERLRDAGRICALTFGSMFAIWVMVIRMR